MLSLHERDGDGKREREREREIEWRRTSAAAAKNHDKSEPWSQESDPKKTSVWRATCMPVASGVCKEGALQRNLLGLGQAGKKASRFSTIAVCRMPSLLNNDQPSPLRCQLRTVLSYPQALRLLLPKCANFVHTLAVQAHSLGLLAALLALRIMV